MMNRIFTLLFAASRLTAVGQVPDYVPTEGMVGWWPFEGSYSNDYSGVTPVEVSEVAFSDGHFGVGQAAFFNDAAYIDLGDMPSPEEFTLTAWIRPSVGALDTWGNVYSDFVSGSGGLALLHSSNQPFTELYSHTTFGSNGTCNTGLELEEESWQFVAMTRNAEGEVKIYWNMQLVGNCQSTTSPAQHPQSAFIGRAAHSNSEHWLGEIDDFGFWSRALNELEMQALYAYQPQIGCTDSEACNYDDNAEFDDGSCVSCEVLATACLEGTIWSEELGGCIVANPADINLDGCVQLNDLLDLLSAYGDCGAEESPWQCGDPLEYQGYDYETVQIGEQCWFAENLVAENYTDGSSIPLHSIGNPVSGPVPNYRCFYDDDPYNGVENGMLYSWYASTDSRGICPSGWHLPSLTDFEDLINVVGGASNAGSVLKVQPPMWNGSDEYGFTALPSGYFNWVDAPYSSDAIYFFMGSYAYFWSSVSSGSNSAYYMILWPDEDYASLLPSNGNFAEDAMSIRCIKDAE